MSGLRPFFTYFGGKWRAAPKYPPPIYDTIVEPFAGSAGYSLRYPERKIILVEKSPAIAGIWRYLIGASEKEILSLPLLEPGQSVDTLDVCQEARWLIGMWVQSGRPSPRANRTPDRHLVSSGTTAESWGPLAQKRISQQQRWIRHWQIVEGDYSLAPNVEATWFVDPPYEHAGMAYPCGAGDIDFCELGAWCRSLCGQVMVCEKLPVEWLAFAPFGAFSANMSATGRTRSAEALWMNDWPGAALWLPGKAAP